MVLGSFSRCRDLPSATPGALTSSNCRDRREPSGDLDWSAVGCSSPLDKTSRQIDLIPISNHPPGNESTVEVDDHIEVIIDPFGWAHERGDIPAPQLVPVRTNLPVSAHNVVHGPPRAEIFFFIKQCRIDGARQLIGKPLTVERLFHLFDL